jgi:hypothetical protein
MFDLDGVLLSPDRRPTSLGEQAGSRGIVVVGVGKGGKRGFQMAYRFNCVGKQLMRAGVNLVLIYPKASSRHVLDPLSVASSRFHSSPVLLLDGDGHFFRQPQQARSLSFAHMDRGLRLIAAANVDLQDNAWADLLQTFLSSTLESERTHQQSLAAQSGDAEPLELLVKHLIRRPAADRNTVKMS